MQQANQSWIALFRRIPGNLHEALILGLRTGTELVLQRMIRLDPDFMIIRGRVSGTQDSGRVIMVPYGELSFVTVARDLKDPEIDAIFGKAAPVAAADLPSLPASTDAATPAEPTAEEVAAEELAAEEANAPKRPEPVSKTALLAKLRERMKETK